VWTVAFLFANMFECVPISESWKNAPGLGTNPHCIHAVSMYMAQVYTDVIMDVLILIVPMPLSKVQAQCRALVLINCSLETATSHKTEIRRVWHVLIGFDVRSIESKLVFCG